MFMRIVLILFYTLNTDAHQDSKNSYIGSNQRLQMKVNGEYLMNVKYNYTNYLIRNQYLYEEKALNITCEAINFMHDMWLDYISINVNNGTTKSFLQNKNSIMISYKPSPDYDLKCATNRTKFPHPKEYSYILKFKKKPMKEPSGGYEPSSTVKIFSSVLIVVTVLMIIIIIIKIKKWWTKKNNENNNGSDLLSTHMTPVTKTVKENQVNENNCSPYAVTGVIYSVPTKHKQNYVNINNTTNNSDNRYNNGNQNDYVNTEKEEWLSNSAYETLSNLYCEAK